MKIAFRVLVLAALSLPSPAQVGLGIQRELRPRAARVWVVDSGGGGDFATIQPAVDAASPGDVVRVVANATHSGFEIDGKALTLVGETGDEIQSACAVRNLAAGESVVLRGFVLSVYIGFSPFDPALTLEENQGIVWMEDCRIFQRRFFASSPYPDALSVQDAAVTIVRCDVELFDGLSDGSSQNAALRAVRSSLHAFESTFTGADRPLYYTAGDGSLAAEVRDGFLFASGCSFQGGDGGYLGCVSNMGLGGSDGGPGLVLSGTTEAHAIGCSFAGGAGGPTSVPTFPCSNATPGPAGSPGQPVVGAIEILPGTARTYELTPSRTTGAATLTASGTPGDLVVSVVGKTPAQLYLPLHLGSQLVAPPFAFVVEGTIPAGGTLSVPRTLLPPLRPAALRVELRQGFFFPPGGEAYLGSGSAVTVLP